MGWSKFSKPEYVGVIDVRSDNIHEFTLEF